VAKWRAISPDLERLLLLTTHQAFDTDPVGRILAGSNDSGSTQLIEISGDGNQTVLTALPGACTGRYVTGERAVIVSHDDGGNERHQLSPAAAAGRRRGPGGPRRPPAAGPGPALSARARGCAASGPGAGDRGDGRR